MRLYIVNAFTSPAPGSGNPAAVVPLGAAPFPPAPLLQRLAAQHNLSETAFYRTTAPGRAELRWFTPEVEVDLCGHATLAAAFVHLVIEGSGDSAITFETLSGPLTVRLRDDGALEMNFPSRPPVPLPASEWPEELFAALRLPREEALFVGKARDYVVQVRSAAAVRALRPDYTRLARIDALCVAVAAVGGGGGAPDVVSRVFCPACGVPEDPATGSAHCTIAPHFAALLGRDALHCEQASARGGVLRVALLEGGRVALTGRAALYMSGVVEASALVL
jgi:PhzF family phenazine biosynthesis protein